MCLLAWNWQPGSAQPLLLVGNRDEFYARPTEPLHRWALPDGTGVVAGRDLRDGGTMLMYADPLLAPLRDTAGYLELAKAVGFI